MMASTVVLLLTAAKAPLATSVQVLLSLDSCILPAMVPVMLFTAYRGLAATSPDSVLMPLLYDALTGGNQAERLGLPAAADPAQVRQRAREMYDELQRMALMGRSAAEEDSRVRLIAMVTALLS